MSAQADWSDLLKADETVLWTGRPSQGVRLTLKDWVLLPMSLLAVLFAVVFSASDAPLLRGLGVLLAPLALYALIGRLLHDAWLRAGTEYALTDRRALIRRRRGRPRLQIVDLSRNPRLVLMPPRDGRGSIYFGRPPPLLVCQGRPVPLAAFRPASTYGVQFFGVDDAERLYARIQERIRQLNPSASEAPVRMWGLTGG